MASRLWIEHASETWLSFFRAKNANVLEAKEPQNPENHCMCLQML